MKAANCIPNIARNADRPHNLSRMVRALFLGQRTAEHATVSGTTGRVVDGKMTSRAAHGGR